MIKTKSTYLLFCLVIVNFLLMGSATDNTNPEEITDPVLYQPHEYKNTCFLAYRWDENGDTWVLLGREKRRSGYVWFDFCGKKDPEDENSWQTALREAAEETADQLKFREGIVLTYRGEKNRGDTVHYIARVQNIDPYFIQQAAEKLKKERQGQHIEKAEWKWVKLEDLLAGTSNLELYHRFRRTIKTKPRMRKCLQLIIQQGKLIKEVEQQQKKEVAQQQEENVIDQLRKKLDEIIILQNQNLPQLKQTEEDIKNFIELTGDEERYSQLFINVLEEIAIKEATEKQTRQEMLQ